MKKTLIALAVGAALAPAAHADVVLTGVINVGPSVHVTSGGTDLGLHGNSVTAPTGVAGVAQGEPQTGQTWGLSRNYSWLGVGSTEDLGGGLKLDVFLQLQMEPEKNGNITNRNSRVGFTGESWGGVWWGTNENIYERYLYSTDPLDGAMGIGGNLSIFGSPGYNVVFDAPRGGPDYATCAAGAGGGGCAGFYRRTEHTIWYDSPNWNGFTFGAAYAMPAFKQQIAGAQGATLNPNIWSLGVKYQGPTIPVDVWLAYERHKDYGGMVAIQGALVGNPTNSTDTGINAGVGYTFGDVRVFGMWEALKYKVDGSDAVTAMSEYKRQAWGVGLKWNLASGYVGAQYLQAQDGKCTFLNPQLGGCDATDSGAALIGVGYFHNMSKQTQVYGVAAYIKNKDFASYAPAGGLGVYNGSVSPGQDITSFTVGIKHSF